MPVFLIITGVGFLFLLISALAGGDHEVGGHEFHLEHDHDVGHDHEASEGGGSPSPFSMRIIAIFLTAFGAAGAIARYYSLSYTMSSLVGLGGGFVVAFITFELITFFYHQQASSTVSSSDLLNSLAEVKIEIPAAGLGQVSVLVKNQRLYFPARSKDAIKIGIGSSVKIVECPGDSVVVQKL